MPSRSDVDVATALFLTLVQVSLVDGAAKKCSARKASDASIMHVVGSHVSANGAWEQCWTIATSSTSSFSNRFFDVNDVIVHQGIRGLLIVLAEEKVILGNWNQGRWLARCKFLH